MSHDLFAQFRQNITRRYLFSKGSHVLGTAALASLMSGALTGAASANEGGHPVRCRRTFRRRSSG